MSATSSLVLFSLAILSELDATTVIHSVIQHQYLPIVNLYQQK